MKKKPSGTDYLAEKEAEELWGALEPEDVTIQEVSFLKQTMIGLLRTFYRAETEITYALKIGRFRNRPPGPER